MRGCTLIAALMAGASSADQKLTVTLRTRDGSQTVVSNRDLPLRQWAHVAVTCEENRVLLLVDGAVDVERQFQVPIVMIACSIVLLGRKSCVFAP